MLVVKHKGVADPRSFYCFSLHSSVRTEFLSFCYFDMRSCLKSTCNCIHCMDKSSEPLAHYTYTSNSRYSTMLEFVLLFPQKFGKVYHMARCLILYSCGNGIENTWIQRLRGVVHVCQKLMALFLEACFLTGRNRSLASPKQVWAGM